MAFLPLCASRSIPMIRSSLNRFFIQLPILSASEVYIIQCRHYWGAGHTTGAAGWRIKPGRAKGATRQPYGDPPGAPVACQQSRTLRGGRAESSRRKWSREGPGSASKDLMEV
jgi:hypothetical protein